MAHAVPTRFARVDVSLADALPWAPTLRQGDVPKIKLPNTTNFSIPT
jgi:hypothetical protein